MPSAFLLRDARHAMHDIFFCASLQVYTPFCALPEAISDGRLDPTTDIILLLTTCRGGSHLTSDILSITVIIQETFYNSK